MFKSLLLKGRTLCLLLCCIISSLAVTAQTKHSGKVIGSDDKLPVVGASVRIKGTNTGAVTDVNGEFTLSLAPGNVLVVSYLTYKTKEVTVQGDQYLTISLEPANTTLNEVIVTGYQTQRKKDISGAVASVDVSAAKVIPTTNSASLLQGQAAGVTVVQSGAPGAGANVFVRGIGNFDNSGPLYVIDGVQRGGMGDLNPNDIESISVLKDAGSAAIYGIAGGNGVVVITTKKGKQGKTRFTYDAFYGQQIALGGNPFNVLTSDNLEALFRQIQPANQLLVNGHFADYGYQSASAKGQASAGDPAVDPAKYVLDPNNPGNDYLIQKFNKGVGTDWFHALFKNAPQQSHTVSLSGASDKNNYYFSLGYLNQQGTLIDTYYKRYQARVNTNFAVSNSIRVGETLSVYFEESPQGGGGIPGGNQSEGNAISFSYRMMPQIPVYDIKGNFGGTYDGLTQLGNGNNPVATQSQNGLDLSRGWNIVGSTYGEIDFLKHFTVKTQIGLNINNYYYNNTTLNPYWSGEGHAGDNGYQAGAGYSSQYNWTNTLQYSQVFGKHSIKAFAGFEAKDNLGQNVQASVSNLFSLDPAYVSIGGGKASSILASGGPGTETSTLSFFGRLDYIFNDRYILAATIRRDGTSLFFPGRQWGTFPSVSLAWRVSQEDFLKGVSWIQDLKLRGSYGQLGYLGSGIGDGNPYSSFRADFNHASYAIDGSSGSAAGGFYASQIGNKKTTWETDVITNVGLDASLFNHLDVTVEWFNKTSKNLLYQLTLPATVGGATAPTVNVAQVSNKGVELSATYHGKIGSEVSFYGGANITTYHSNIDKISNDVKNNYFDDNGQRQGRLVRDQVGHPIGSFFGYQVDGYWNTQAEIDAANANAASKTGKQDAVFQNGNDAVTKGELLGDFKYHDTNGDGVITDADRTFIGNPNPKFTYGINLGASWKGFDLSTVLYGSYGGKIYNFTKYWVDFGDTFTGNKSNDLLFNSWTPSKPNAATPKAQAVGGFGTSSTINSWYVSSGSFLKMRSLSLGYTFNSGVLKNLGVDKLHIYAQGVNLFTATKYKGLDPELLAVGSNGLGTDIGAYPNNEKKYIFGVNLSF